MNEHDGHNLRVRGTLCYYDGGIPELKFSVWCHDCERHLGPDELREVLVGAFETHSETVVMSEVQN